MQYVHVYAYTHMEIVRYVSSKSVYLSDTQESLAQGGRTLLLSLHPGHFNHTDTGDFRHHEILVKLCMVMV